MFLSPKQKRCAKRGHGYVANYETGEVISGCVYCGAYSGTRLGIAASSAAANPLDVATRIAVIVCMLAIATVGVACATWLAGAL